MILSIVIVNYNVKYFLEQCLESVFRSDLTLGKVSCGAFPNADSDRIALEVFVVDNASVDGSVEMVREKFPQVHVIANTENSGFAAANNQALRIATGDLLLLLNPDTVVERDTLRKCVEFYASHPDCGGLGVKMVNGEGIFLKESKRGFPSPAASFYKLSGLIRLFPRSRRFAAYYMGHLPDDQTNPIDILPGAYLMISREAYAKIGGLDELYFMYGEDIDFSWRIKLAGYQNYYLPEARIIHYKGESTRHGSMNYVYTFYNAMAIFVRRYFSGTNAWLFNLLLHLAIWARASLAWIKRIGQALLLPVADFAAAYAGFLGIKHIWSTCWVSNINYYPAQYTCLIIPLYILLLMFVSWLYGGYQKPVKLGRIVKGMAIGAALLLVFYSLLDESLRYSRALLLLGCAWTLVSTLALRGVLSLLRVQGYDLRPQRRRTCVIIGSADETLRVKRLYETLDGICVETLADSAPDARKVNDAIHCYKADEVVFCNRDISIRQIIDLMMQLGHMPGKRTQVEYKIAPDESNFIIGSNSIHSSEDLYTEDLHSIASPLAQRNKRIFDICSAALLLLLSPLLVWFQHSKGGFFRDCWRVLCGRLSWVGISQSVFGPEHILSRRDASITPELQQRLHTRYLRNYRLSTDMQILLKNLKKL